MSNKLFEIQDVIRTNISSLKPYSSARDEYSGEAMVFLDANENPFNSPYNRYPDPLQRELKEKIEKIKHCPINQIFLGNGSDEPIDLVLRAFCNPGIDNIITVDPTYGMYQVAADINQVEVRKATLTSDFKLDTELVLSKIDQNTKVIFLCSPNNPSGNLLENEEIKKIIKAFHGLVVVDEAYIDFSPDASLLSELGMYPNLIILQTFSKAWGMAGIRLGMAFASPEIISIFNKIKYPYNINILTQQKALELLDKEQEKHEWVDLLLIERERVAKVLSTIPEVKKVYHSDSNFLLVKMKDAHKTYNKLVEKGVIVRDRSKITLCDDCLRITIGTNEENDILLKEISEF